MAVKKSDSHFERRREYLSTLPEWRNLIEHFELNDHAFAYIPLLVPNDLWAHVCEVALESYLSAKGKHLYKIDCQTPDDVKNIAVTLFALKVEEDTEAIWITAPIGNGESFFEEWSDAWREGMARLNQYRNPLKDKFPVTILFVGAQWIQELTRNMAPDLWSIRRTVIRLEPKVDFSKPQEYTRELSPSKSVAPEHFEVDTDLVIRLAERIKGKDNSELELANLFYDLANGYFQQDQYQFAVDAADKAIKIYTAQIELKKNKSHRAEINIKLAELYFIKAYSADNFSKNKDIAIENYQKAIGLNPNDAYAYNNLGLLLAEDESRLVEAEAMYRTAIKLNPNDADAHYNLGILLAEDESRRDEAEAMYRKAIELKPNDANAYSNLGVLLAKDESRRDEAEQLYRKAIELNPNVANAYSNLGVLLAEDESRRDEAEQLYRKAIELNPNVANAYSNLGLLLAEDESRLDEAEAMYRKAIELKPNDADTHYNLSVLLAEDESRRDEAERMYRKAIELNPSDADAHYNLGWLLAEDESRRDEAEQMYRKAIELNPNDAYAYNNLGLLLAEDESRLVEAEAMYRTAIKLNPNDGSVYYNLACLRSLSMKEENNEEAIEFLKKAIELDLMFKELAKTDSDFDFVRDDSRFKELVGD